jgi:hypothetical protein
MILQLHKKDRKTFPSKILSIHIHTRSLIWFVMGFCHDKLYVLCSAIKCWVLFNQLPNNKLFGDQLTINYRTINHQLTLNYSAAGKLHRNVGNIGTRINTARGSTNASSAPVSRVTTLGPESDLPAVFERSPAVNRRVTAVSPLPERFQPAQAESTI